MTNNDNDNTKSTRDQKPEDENKLEKTIDDTQKWDSRRLAECRYQDGDHTENKYKAQQSG